MKPHIFLLTMLLSVPACAALIDLRDGAPRVDGGQVTHHEAVVFNRPAVGGTQRVLAIAPYWARRDLVELVQRTDVVVEHVTPDDPNLFRRVRAGEQRITLIAPMDWETLPDDVRERLVVDTRAGRGLLLLHGATPDEGPLAEVFEAQTAWMNPTAGLPAAATAGAVPRIRAADVGVSRVLSLRMGEPPEDGYALVSRAACHGSDADYEQSMAVVVRALDWVLRRPTAMRLRSIDLDPSLHDQEQPGDLSLLVAVDNDDDSAKTCQTRVTLRHLESDILWGSGASLEIPPGASDLPLLVRQPRAGRQLLTLSIKDGDAVAAWGQTIVHASTAVEISHIEVPSRPVVPGEPFRFTVGFAKPPAADLSLHLHLLDGYRRLLWRDVVPLRRGVTGYSGQAALTHPRCAAHTLVAVARDGDVTIDLRERELVAQVDHTVDGSTPLPVVVTGTPPPGRHGRILQAQLTPLGLVLGQEDENCGRPAWHDLTSTRALCFGPAWGAPNAAFNAELYPSEQLGAFLERSDLLRHGVRRLFEMSQPISEPLVVLATREMASLNQLLDDMHLTPSRPPLSELVDISPDQARVIWLDEALALSNADVALLEQYAHRGGTVVAGRLPHAPALQQLLGARRDGPADWQPVTVARFGMRTAADASIQVMQGMATGGDERLQTLITRTLGEGRTWLLNLDLDDYLEARETPDAEAWRIMSQTLFELAGLQPQAVLAYEGQRAWGREGYVLRRWRVPDGDAQLLALLPQPGRPSLEPWQARLALPPGLYGINLLSGRGYRRMQDVREQLGPGEAMVIGMLPDARLSMDLEAEPSTAQPGELVRFRAVVRHDQPTASVLHIMLIDPDGNADPAYRVVVPLRDGEAQWVLQTALNDREGAWRIQATDILCGRGGTGTLRLRHDTP